MSIRKSHVALLVVLVIAAFWAWRSMNATPSDMVPTTVPARTDTVTQTVLASGMLEAAEIVSVGARVSGQIETLAVTLGQQVQAGDLIAQIDSQDQQNTLLQAQAALSGIEAQIAAKEASLAQAQAFQARQEQLGRQNLSSQEAVENASAAVRVAEAELDALHAQKSSAEVTVSTARVALERTRVIAPISGTVVAIVVKQGQTVNAAQAAPTIVKIANLSTMVVKAEISEADVMRVQPGQPVTFTTLGAPDDPFEAVVRQIEPAPAEIETSDTISSDRAIYYIGRLEVANPDGALRIGMTAEVAIELARADEVITVPSGAIRRDSSGQYVEVLNQATGTVERRDVTVGLNNRVLAEISSGLSDGDLVVTGTAPARPAGATGGARGRMGPSLF